MTFLEAKEALEKQYFADCKTPEDCQKVVGEYAIKVFGEENAQKCINKLQKIQTRYQRRNPEPTPEVMNAIFSDFGKFLQLHRYVKIPNYNPAEMYIMTVVASEISERIENQ
jgi:hypothetical protein